MLRKGAPKSEMKAMGEETLFLSRLQLLIIMGKAYLQKFPLGAYRRKAIVENAHWVFYASLKHANEIDPEAGKDVKGDRSSREMSPSHIFHQRVQLLAIMLKAIGEDRFSGEHKIRSLQENLDQLCKTITFSVQLPDMDILKVA